MDVLGTEIVTVGISEINENFGALETDEMIAGLTSAMIDGSPIAVQTFDKIVAGSPRPNPQRSRRLSRRRFSPALSRARHCLRSLPMLTLFTTESRAMSL